jgi:lysozyme
MRVSAAASAILIACLGVSGCTSSSSTETALTVPPATIKTARLQPSAGMAMPSAPVPATTVPDIDPTQVAAINPPAGVNDPHALAWNGQAPEPHVFDGMATTVGMPVPSERPVAGLRPAVEPSFAEPPLRRGRAERLKIYSHRFRDAKPMNFGRVAPRQFAVHGVDVSRWQANIDWPTLRTQGANFAYIKATDGGDHIDPMFRTNWRGAKEAGIRRGAYHFFYWCRTAGEQADWFIRNVPRDPDALPPVIDVEYNHQSDCKMKLSTERVLEKMQVFMDKLEKYYGQRPVIYTAPDFYADHLQGQFLNHPFWLRSVAAHPSKIYPDRKWLFWQYSGSGLSQGVDNKIDLNVFNGSENGWHDWVARTTWSGSAVAER